MISPAKFRKLHQALNGVARKVYDATPIGEFWTVAQILGELKRNGSTLGQHVVHGSLSKMADDGLLRERGKNEYRREEVRASTTPTAMEIAMTETILKPQKPVPPPLPAVRSAPAVTTPLQRLENLEQRMNGLVQRFASASQELLDLHESLTDTLIELQDQQEDPEIAKLRQLSAVLKSLQS